ncbi:MAG TPA: hypothetical protein VIL32_10405, partial [Steroidobacteraceae bacterium]
MKLADIVDGNRRVLISTIGADVQLAREIQTQLAAMGVLDPPPDSIFGPVSHWALSQVLKAMGESGKTFVDRELAEVLLEGESSSLFRLKVTKTLAGRIVAAMLENKHW